MENGTIGYTGLIAKLSILMPEELAQEELDFVRYLADTYSLKFDDIAAAYVDLYQKLVFNEKNPDKLRYILKTLIKAGVNEDMSGRNIAEMLKIYGDTLITEKISKADFESKIGSHFKNSKRWSSVILREKINDSAYPEKFLEDFFDVAATAIL